MEWARQPETRNGFFDALGEDDFVLTGAYCILMGVEPYTVIDVDDETYLIKAAMLRKAVELRTQEIQATAQLTAQALQVSLFS